MDFRFRKNERLRKQKEFEEVFKKGTFLKGKFVSIIFLERDSRKAGFIVSKKVSKKAVVRNKIKRRLREIYRINKHCIRKNVHVVLIAKKDAANVGFRDFEDDVKKLFEKINFKTD